ncbi:hypothetical protein [Frankia sp. QA3]|uniref:hypothetical protein n=1 Tax=Frankia sp. QA3 TaxID=710111 RepID=UPI000302609B|nr:hypothetical protein [Frankia sp. QA3]
MAVRDTDLKSFPVISLPGVRRILSAEVARTSRPDLGFAVSPRPAEAAELGFHFDFLDRHDGAVIEVLAEGRPDTVSVDGTIIGARDGFRKVVGRPSPWRQPRAVAGVVPVLGTLAFAMAVWGFPRSDRRADYSTPYWLVVSF